MPAIQALAFDAYGTLFDVHSVVSACNQEFPGRGHALSKAWRAKQLEYTWLRSLMGRYEDFWKVTESALVFACNSLKLTLPPPAREKLMNAYLRLDPFPEVGSALKALSGYRLAILSNGSPRMLAAAVESVGLWTCWVNRAQAAEEELGFRPDTSVETLAGLVAALGGTVADGPTS